MEQVSSAPDRDESAHTTGRKSGRSKQVEIITRGERRRSWSMEQKREIVAESFGPELTPSEVARKHAISSGQLYTWRRELLGAHSKQITRGVPRFAQVELEPAPLSTNGSGLPPVDVRAVDAHAALSHVDGLIEIVLPGGVVLRVDAHVDGRALRRILGALEGQ
jgi:transposase